jgi:hypothetical protein
VKARARLFAGEPWKGRNPGEHPAVGALTACSARKGLSQGSKPRSCSLPGRVVVSTVAVSAGKTAGGCFRTGTFGYLVRGESSEG